MVDLNNIELSFRNLTDPNYRKLGPKQHEPIQDLVKPHVDSFNWFINTGIQHCIQDIQTDFLMPDSSQITIYFKSIEVSAPEMMHVKNLENRRSEKIYPSECRQRGVTYCSSVTVEIGWKINNIDQMTINRHIGYLPIMVKSEICHLHGLSPSQLVKKGEEAEEAGGYFIMKGLERIIRMLIMPRRNYPLAVERKAWSDKGQFYTDYGITIRCVKPNLTSSCTNTLHYLTNGSAVLSFSLMKQEFFVPVIIIIRAISSRTSDDYIYEEMMRGETDREGSFLGSCVRNMLRDAHREGLATQAKALNYMGELFRVKLDLPEWYTNEQVAQYLMDKLVCIHLTTAQDKVNLLIFMTRKLFAFAKGKCCAESPDSLMFQEVLLPGHLMQLVLHEKLQDWLNNLRANILRAKKDATELDENLLRSAVRRVSDITNPLHYMISTGRIVSKTGLGLMQDSGMTVVAERLNYYRFLSHFRAVHRGTFFTTMRTTTVRKLYPETWGFMCPVHTPDGTPCGLLCHLTYSCQAVASSRPGVNKILFDNLVSLGVTPLDFMVTGRDGYDGDLPVLVDGVILGWAKSSDAELIASGLRKRKVLSIEGVPKDTEICLVPNRDVAAQYPGLYIFTSPARLVRPVLNLATDSVEIIGSFEQAYLNICNKMSEAYEGLTTHMELHKFATLSELASLTPFSNFNQSCRNMYQCQMSKQTMGTPLLAWPYRNDNKHYRISTPQTPLVRTAMYDYLALDEYPIGTNAIVAVMSYTGYDMEDAMIINKATFERGFAFGSIYKTETVDLKQITGERNLDYYEFGANMSDANVKDKLDADGFPAVGVIIMPGDPLYSYKDLNMNTFVVVKYHGKEMAYVDQIKLCGDENQKIKCSLVHIVLRIMRNPTIGDKFSSRHGQKGICSQFYPARDMPFTGTGQVPDIIFNPHGFPSRMTIGMMVELMAGKSAAEHGLCHDSTPFKFNEENNPIEYFGNCLQAAGYNYHGTEMMYSGITGNALEVYIFKGVVYYQRLRHMVLDKWQVRSTGPVDSITQQPIGGRKRGGGVRFGEMERDALIAHGCSFLLQDRLMHCSDGVEMAVCSGCGSLISSMYGPPKDYDMEQSDWSWKCLVCSANSKKSENNNGNNNNNSENADTPDNEGSSSSATEVGAEKNAATSNAIGVVYVPSVFRYMTSLLASVNVKVKLDVRQQ